MEYLSSEIATQIWNTNVALAYFLKCTQLMAMVSNTDQDLKIDLFFFQLIESVQFTCQPYI